jgi:beta-glucosidase
MKKIILPFLSIILMLFGCKNEISNKTKEPFLWGVATSAYQVEGAYQADGKGESKWDYLTNTVGITQMVIGQKQTGNVSINMYDRTQYLKDIQLMKELGVNAYRMSLNWSRIIPDGTGTPNEVALKHYDVLFDDLMAAGIEPLVTLYHFDYPYVLMQKGGWGNPEMVKWYTNYASVVLNRYGKKVKHFMTFNEPFVEFFLAENLFNGQKTPLTKEQYMGQMQKTHNLLLANAQVTKMYHDLKLPGEIGIALNLNPAAPWDTKKTADVEAVKFQDVLINDLFLDPLFKGHYPQMALDSLATYNPSFKPSAEDMALIASQKPDFLGVNYYSPAVVKGEDSPMLLKWMGNNPDTAKSIIGSDQPEYLYKILMRLKTEYGNPKVYITENGTGYKSEDVKVNNKINDPKRADYLKRHIAAVLKAKKEGANLNGYMVWSGWDNFEWVAGFTSRYGLIYVDFATQERTPKQSFYEYKNIIEANKGL